MRPDPETTRDPDDTKEEAQSLAFQDDRRNQVQGARTMSQGFLAQYAEQAALSVEGVASLAPGVLVSLKEAVGAEHAGKGIKVFFLPAQPRTVIISVYVNVWYGYILPDVAWTIQDRVRRAVELYTGYLVHAVDVFIVSVVDPTEESTAKLTEESAEVPTENATAKSVEAPEVLTKAEEE